MADVRVARIPQTTPRRTDRDRAREAERRRDHLKVVGPVRRTIRVRLSRRSGVVLTVLAFVALFGVAASHALLIQNQASVDALDQQVATAQARYEKLRLEVSELESPQRISTEAQQELGMVPAGETVWLTPDQPAPADGPVDDAIESTDTSAERVKPYLEAAP
jgi:cell division protein FtsL